LENTQRIEILFQLQETKSEHPHSHSPTHSSEVKHFAIKIKKINLEMASFASREPTMIPSKLLRNQKGKENQRLTPIKLQQEIKAKTN